MLRLIEGYESFNAICEVLQMLKARHARATFACARGQARFRGWRALGGAWRGMWRGAWRGKTLTPQGA